MKKNEEKLTLDQLEIAYLEINQEYIWAAERYKLDAAYTRKELASAQTLDRSAASFEQLKAIYLELNQRNYRSMIAWEKKASKAALAYNNELALETVKMILSA